MSIHRRCVIHHQVLEGLECPVGPHAVADGDRASWEVWDSRSDKIIYNVKTSTHADRVTEVTPTGWEPQHTYHGRSADGVAVGFVGAAFRYLTEDDDVEGTGPHR